MKIHSCISLIPMACLTCSCATPLVLDRAHDRKVLHDELEPVQRAYLTPDNQLVLCASGTLGGASSKERFTLSVPWQKYSQQVIDSNVRGKIAELPRMIVRAGWPSEPEARTKGLQPIPIGTASFGLALGDEADAIRAKLRPLPTTEHTLYNITGYGTQEYWTVVYVRNAEAAETPHQVAFTIQRREVCTGRHWLLLVPLAVVTDAAIVLGSVCAAP